MSDAAPRCTPLDGLRVIELAGGFAGPFAGMMLADYGADVVKIEPPRGDWARGQRGFETWNRGKRSVVVDLAAGGPARDRAHDLIRTADVVITNLRPGVAGRLGMAWDDVQRVNPAAICCEISGFGPLSGMGHVKAYEGIVAAKLGKMVDLDPLSGAHPGFAKDRPLFSAAPVASFAAGQLAFQGIVAALIERDRTGAGQRVETSLLHGAITATMRQDFKRSTSAPAVERPVTGPSLQLRGLEVTFLTARCADGKWIQMCARQDHHFWNWMTALGFDDVRGDPRYAGGPLGFRSFDEIDELETRIRKRMGELTQPEWMASFIRHDVGSDPFLTFDEFLEHPQMVANQRVLEVDDPVLGTVRQLGPIATLNGCPSTVTRGAPALDADAGLVDGSRDPSTFATQPSSPAAAEPRGPLSGVTVIELATYLAGPLGGTLLAEMGARVIKIEPLEGDLFRRVGLQFVHLQHGKESIALDLKSPAGAEIVRRLVARADVFFHNFRPGAVDRLGCDVASIERINPSIVYVSAAAYGSHGPEANRAAFHSTPNALSGGGILQAGDGNPPVDDSYPDPCSGLAVASAMLLGLLASRRTGRSQHLETTMLCSTGYVHSNDAVSFAGAPPRRSVDHGQHGFHALYRLYPCRSGWVFLAVVTDHEWTSFATAVDHPEWIDDVRFTDAARRLEHDADLVGEIERALSARDADDWEAALTAADVACVRADGPAFERFLGDSGVMTADVDPTFGDYWRVPTRVTFDGRPGRRGRSTLLGESTIPILAELGFDDDEMATMLADGSVKSSTTRS
jgi:crotonobetainyl-CoA:carnitine CoA-transferase CaiB-like acyl-CoA transferase